MGDAGLLKGDNMCIIYIAIAFVVGFGVGALVYRNNAKRLQKDYYNLKAELRKIQERIKVI